MKRRNIKANANAIAKLKDDTYGPIQVNNSYMPRISGTGGPVHVTNKYPAALHLNSLYCGQQFEPPSKWIQANATFPGFETPVMDDYALVNHPFVPLDPLMRDQTQGQPRPSGEHAQHEPKHVKYKRASRESPLPRANRNVAR